MPHLKKQLSRFELLSEEVQVPAKTILLREGDTSKKAFFIKQGCLRLCFNNNGIDTTFQFAFEGQVISSPESFRKNVPSLFTIESVEPSVLLVISKANYEKMMEELSEDNDFLKMINEALFERQLHYMREFLSFIRDTPQQRYLNLVKEKPHIIQRIPQRYIASYLGITPVHLSRIRNQTQKGKK